MIEIKMHMKRVHSVSAFNCKKMATQLQMRFTLVSIAIILVICFVLAFSTFSVNVRNYNWTKLSKRSNKEIDRCVLGTAKRCNMSLEVIGKETNNELIFIVQGVA